MEVLLTTPDVISCNYSATYTYTQRKCWWFTEPKTAFFAYPPPPPKRRRGVGGGETYLILAHSAIIRDGVNIDRLRTAGTVNNPA